MANNTRIVFTLQAVVLGETIGGTITRLGSGGAFIDDDMPADQEDVELPLAFPTDGLIGFIALSTTDMTIKSNDADTPGNTLELKADEAVPWHDTSPYDCPFTVPVTSIFVTNPEAGHLQIYPIYDASP